MGKFGVGIVLRFMIDIHYRRDSGEDNLSLIHKSMLNGERPHTCGDCSECGGVTSLDNP